MSGTVDRHHVTDLLGNIGYLQALVDIAAESQTASDWTRVLHQVVSIKEILQLYGVDD